VKHNPRRQAPPPWEPLTEAFFTRPTLTVARDLLGRYVVRRVGAKVMAGRIVEVEAYRGPDDPASHAYRGRTPRNDVMFWKGGHLYVYFTYGMHYCANVVTGPEGAPGAVLLRALEPVLGLEHLRQNRPGVRNDRQLTNGPAKICEAFSLSRPENGARLTGPTIFLTQGTPPARQWRARSVRIGIRNGQEKKWRFYERDSPWVSGKRRP
jgi:DNA-3-methyladenine glycosylase